ncbi:hypothetical protein M5E87_03400 [Flavonifractor plautii]|nr:hypothetical protein M5E87_03400 [Flavonifractor plautii]
MKQQVTLALSLTLAVPSGTVPTRRAGASRLGRPKHPLRMPHRARRRAPPLPTR